MKKRITTVLMALICAGAFFAQESYKECFDKGLEYHSRCLNNNEKCAQQAIDAFTKAYELDKNSEVLCWLGSSWTILGDESNNPLNKIDYVMKGCDYMDKAVADDPDNVVTRRIRIETYNALPDIFEKKDVVKKDLNYLMNIYKKTPEMYDDLYDPAWAFYFSGQISIKNGDLKKGKQYLMIARKIVKDKELANSIDKSLGERK